MSAARFTRHLGASLVGLWLLLCGVAQAQQPAPPPANATAFLEMEVDDDSPYVQQSVGIVVRLYYASQLLSGELGLDAPDGASLQRIGQDRSLVREVNGRRFNLVERRYLLIPERSGPLLLPGARFEGRAAGGFFDEMFGGGNGRLRATAPDRPLQVQPQPPGAPQPWLPLHDLRLRYTAAPDRGRAGEAVTVVVEAVADGATRAQFPELPELDAGAGAQVFAEPAQFDETFSGSTPQLKLTRRYAIVPREPGTLVVPGLRLPWWDVRNGQAQTARLPDLTLAVGQGSAAGNSPVPSPTPLDTREALPGLDNALAVGSDPAAVTRPWGWIAAAVGFALLWLVTLLWAWRQRRRLAARGAPAAARPVAAARPGLAQLRQQMDMAGLDEVIDTLAAMGQVQGLQGVLEHLSDPAQRQALTDMQAARWSPQGGSVAQARQALRRAFHDGPHWQQSASPDHTGLAPLYPPGR
ncbi:protein BatD [Stenotrophomonas sp. PS02289]|uniref:protein BatD n=1 Tax=Stenotrophomonas sp. PS02289 TaxID=2991422 RepID=UPI00249BCBC8|nr:protein BatD [Stenotrophomonas sp. PS02289]